MSLNNQIVNLKKYLIIRIVVLAQILSKKMIIFKKYLKFYKINNKIKMIFNKKLLKKIKTKIIIKKIKVKLINNKIMKEI